MDDHDYYNLYGTEGVIPPSVELLAAIETAAIFRRNFNPNMPHPFSDFSQSIASHRIHNDLVADASERGARLQHERVRARKVAARKTAKKSTGIHGVKKRAKLANTTLRK